MTKQTTFKPENRTYHVSRERLITFKALTPEQRLKWAEEIAGFLRLAKASRLRNSATTPD